MKEFEKLDPLIHSRIRLSIMSVLISAKEADFSYLKEATESTDGNLSTHLSKLETAGYIDVEKSFVEKKPHSKYSITEIGKRAFEEYVISLERYIKP